jgi:FHS family L-fucose permease-like MFS transporter
MSQSRPSPLLWVLFLAFFTFGLMGVLAALAPEVIAEFHLTRFEGGFLGSSMFLALAVFAIPSGFLVDRFGARSTILGGVCLMAAGCLTVAQSHTYPVTLAGVFLFGVGTTMLQTGGNPLIRELDVPEHYSRNLTVTIGVCTTGGFLSIFLLTYIRGTGRPWQTFYLLFAVVCLVLLASLAVSRFPPRIAGAERMRLSDARKLVRSPLLLAYVFGNWAYNAAEVGAYYWIPKFFEDVHGMRATANARPATFLEGVFPTTPALVYALFIGMQSAGRLSSGAVLKRFGGRCVMRFYSVMALVSLVVAALGSPWVSAVGFVSCGFFTSVLYPLIFSGTINSFPAYHGTISGLLGTSYIAGFAVTPLQGWIGDHAGMRAALAIPILCMTYVIGLALLGRAKYE